jgi:hypothetical protein
MNITNKGPQPLRLHLKQGSITKGISNVGSRVLYSKTS